MSAGELLVRVVLFVPDRVAATAGNVLTALIQIWANKARSLLTVLGIIIAVLLATTLAFLNEYKANREFDILNRISDDVPIKVIRDAERETAR